MKPENKKDFPPARAVLEVWGVGQWGGRVAGRAATPGVPGVRFRLVDCDRQNLICSPLEENIFYQGPESLGPALEEADVVVCSAGLGSKMAEEFPAIAAQVRGAGTQLLAVTGLPFQMEGKAALRRGRDLVGELEASGIPTVVLQPDRYLSRSRGREGIETVFEETEQAAATAVRVLLNALLADYPERRTVEEIGRMLFPGLTAAAGGWLGKPGDDAVRGAKEAFTRMRLLSRERIRMRSLLVTVSSPGDLPLDEFQALLGVVDGLVPEKALRQVCFRRENEESRRLGLGLLACFPEGRSDGNSPDFPVAPAAPTQSILDLENLNRGMFADIDPNLLGGEDLDIPTFIRRGEHLD